MARVAFVNEEIAPVINEERVILNLSVEEAHALRDHLSGISGWPTVEKSICARLWRELNVAFGKRWQAGTEIERKLVERLAEGEACKSPAGEFKAAAVRVAGHSPQFDR